MMLAGLNQPASGTDLPLRDIHLPAEPSWWPPAPGWWIVTVLAVVLLVFAWRWAMRWRQLARRRALLRFEYDLLMEQTSLSGEEARQVALLSVLLRRAAKRFSPPQIAALQGEEWLQFLDAGDPAKPFSEGAGRLLLDGPYRREVDAEAAGALAQLVGERLPKFVGGKPFRSKR